MALRKDLVDNIVTGFNNFRMGTPPPCPACERDQLYMPNEHSMLCCHECSLVIVPVRMNGWEVVALDTRALDDNG